MDFIPAQKSPLFTSVFKVYTKWLFKYSFKTIWIHQNYKINPADRTVYFLNHSSWWDGLIPFLLNEFHLKQDGRAIMELEQMKNYPFFKRLGAFSIKPDDRVHTLRALQYAVRSMRQDGRALYIYPQGEIVPSGSEINFKKGLSWLAKKLPDVKFIPIGTHMHTIRHHKAELHLWIADPVTIDPEKDLDCINIRFEESLQQVLERLLTTAGYDDTVYRPFF